MITRFGSFEFDPVRRLIVREGRDVHLTPKAFDLLALLILEAPRVVPKAELHQRLWPKVIVSDATLVGLVKELRHALDDLDQDAPIIRTSHRVGYAFNAATVGAPQDLAAIHHWILKGKSRFPLPVGESLIGRDPLSAIWLDYMSVSRRHARITVSEKGALLEDLGSKNGTRVREKPLTGAIVLQDGDSVRVGQILVSYRVFAAGMPTATQASFLETTHSMR